MPIYHKEEAKESGWQQVRQALEEFEGDVSSTEAGTWGGSGVIDPETNQPIPPKEYFEVTSVNNKIIKSTEELDMDISATFNFRINCSSSPKSFWVSAFLESADKNKLQIPEQLIGKRISWKAVVFGTGKYATKNFVIDHVVEVASKPTDVPVTTTATIPAVVAKIPAEDDLMQEATNLAVGKTEQQFRTAIGMNVKFAGNPLLAMAKNGILTLSLVKEGKLKEVQENGVTVYRKP